MAGYVISVGRNQGLQPMFTHYKPERYDGVKEEMEKRRPIYQREQFRAVVVFLLIIGIWLVARLMGLDTPFPFHLF